MASIFDILSGGLSGSVGGLSSLDEVDPTVLMGLSKLSTQDLQQILAAIQQQKDADFQKNKKTLPNLLGGDLKRGEIWDADHLKMPEIGNPPPAFLDYIRDAVKPPGGPVDYRNAGLVPGIYEPTPSPSPSPTPTASPTPMFSPSPTASPRPDDPPASLIRGAPAPSPSPESTDWKWTGLPGGPFHVLSPADYQNLPTPPGLDYKGTPIDNPTARNVEGQAQSLRDASARAIKALSKVQDPSKALDQKMLDLLQNESPSQYTTGVPYHEKAPPRDEGPQYSEELPQYSQGEADLTGGSSPVPPEEQRYSDVGNLNMDLPSGPIVKDVVEKGAGKEPTPQTSYPSPAPTPEPPSGPLGAVNVTDPPPVPAMIPPPLTPADAGIGTNVAKSVMGGGQFGGGGAGGSYDQETPGGGLSSLKNILAGFHPSTPAGQALMAFGFANAAPGGNFGTAGLQALQTYTSAQNRRAEEQLEREKMASRKQEIQEGRDFQVKRQELGWQHSDAVRRQDQQFQRDTAIWQAGETGKREEARERRQDVRAEAAREQQRKHWSEMSAEQRMKELAALKKQKVHEKGVAARTAHRERAQLERQIYAPFTLNGVRYQYVRTAEGMRLIPVAGTPKAGAAGNAPLVQGIYSQIAALEAQQEQGRSPTRQYLIDGLKNLVGEASLGGTKADRLASDHQKLIQKATGEWNVQDIPPLQAEQQQEQQGPYDREDLQNIRTQLNAGAIPEPQIAEDLRKKLKAEYPDATDEQIQQAVVKGIQDAKALED